MKFYSIAVDGPSGSGKGTIVKRIANTLGFRHIDTGAMYRAVALKAIWSGFDTNDEKSVISLLHDLNLKISFDDSGQTVHLDNKNINDKIRTPEVSTGASNVSKFQLVRIKLVEIQRELAKHENIIMEGRDIGTFVLPDADVKIFLTASVEERARRRFDELVQKGVETTYEETKRLIEERDYQDSHREFAPLSVAEDAAIVDTSNMDIDRTVKEVTRIIKEKINI